MAKRTPLYETHLKYGGRIVEFAGWELPVQYEGIIAEHKAVRQAAGLFDVSHMGEIIVSGPVAERQIQHLVTNDISGMRAGDVHYSPMCYENGGVVDDVLVYKLADDRYFIVVNASNTDKDYEWMTANNIHGAAMENVSSRYAQLALQGPASAEILAKLIDDSQIPKKYYSFSLTNLFGKSCILSRTGYTGEDGFEVYLEPADAPLLWETLMEEGEDLGLVSAGLGARDTLRLEASMPLYGHELTPDITPLEAVLGRFVRLEKEEFIGKEALVAQKAAGLARKRCGLEILDKGIAREGASVFAGGNPVGVVTSGTKAPWLDKSVAMAMLPPDLATPGTTVEVEVRGRMLPAQVIKMPFYKRLEGKQ